MIAGAGIGILRTMLVSREKVADLIPVDVAINAMIVAAWKIGTRSRFDRSIPIYNCTSGSVNPITWGNIEEWALVSLLKYPMDTMVWYPGGGFKSHVLHDRVCRFLFHYLPALVLDFILVLLWKPRFVSYL